MLSTVARIDGKLHGFSFSTLERIGGTPCVLHRHDERRRHSKRDQVLHGLMDEAYHRALMAFPDEDVVVGSRFVAADALDGFKELDEVTPQPGLAGGRRGAGVGSPARQAIRRRQAYDEKTFVVTANGRGGFLDFESLEAREDRAAHIARCSTASPPTGGSLIVYGWTMAEDLVKLGGR